MKKILILGHTGFVGNEISKKLKKNKLDFDCYSRKEVVFNNKKLRTRNNIIKKLIFKNDYIINCVGENINQEYMYSRNYKFVDKILEIIKKSNKKKYLIHLSSCAVYGRYFHYKDYLINDRTKPDPISKYAKTKLKADELIIKSNIKNLNYIILRPSQVVGLNMNAVGFVNLSKFIKRRFFVYVSTKKAVRNYVDSEDLSTIVYKMCSRVKFKNNIYLISRYSKLKNIVDFIEKKLKIKSYYNFIIPKIFLIFFVSAIRFFYKDFPVSKEIIEGLSITTKIKSNLQEFKGLKLKNINNYLSKINK